jgi:hypothetical protein
VFEKSSPFQSYTVKGNIGTGPGTNDMKGGLVDMIFALKALQAAGVLKETEITVVLSGDEEAHGEPASISRRDMIAAACHSDVALEFEGTPRQEGVFYGSVSRRSSITWHIRTTGETGHSSGIFSEGKGYGAIYELTRILDAFRTQLPEPYLTYNVGMALGGTSLSVDATGDNGTAAGKDNVIAPTAYASGDIRTLSNEQTERVEKKMQAIVAQHLAKTGATIEFGEGYPAMAPTAQSRAVLGILNQVNASLGAGPHEAGCWRHLFCCRYDSGIGGHRRNRRGRACPRRNHRSLRATHQHQARCDPDVSTEQDRSDPRPDEHRACWQVKKRVGGSSCIAPHRPDPHSARLGGTGFETSRHRVPVFRVPCDLAHTLTLALSMI